MSIAPWRSPLARALHRNRAATESRYLQLATVTPEGHPANRTVVFRGFYGDTDQIKIISDRRSDKVSQLQHHPWAELCWYFAKTREQFRIFGKITLIDAQGIDPKLRSERQVTWQNISDPARAQFGWPVPKQPLESVQSAPEKAIANGQSPVEDHRAPIALDPTNPPANFCLLLLEPQRVDHLELGDPHLRYLHEHTAATWYSQPINP